MSTLRLLWVPCIIVGLQSAALPQSGDPLGLEERVKEADLIVVGKLHPLSTISRHSNSGRVEIEEVLLGAASTNKPLEVQYATDERFIPGHASSTHAISRTNKYICFLASRPVTNGPNTAPVVVPVGKGEYACNGFELLTDKALAKTRDLIAERNKKR